MNRGQTHKDRMARASTGVKMGLSHVHADACQILQAHGRFIFDLRDLSGHPLAYWEHNNIIVRDAGIHAARLFKDPLEPAHGINMLAIGTGATGALLSPNAPDPRQRRLNAEIARKGFSAVTFRDSGGTAVSYPTNIVDYTTTFGEAEAVGALNEMGVISTISDNPSTKHPNPDAFPTYTNTLDLSNYDVLINYLPYAVISKPSASVLTITWRLTF